MYSRAYHRGGRPDGAEGERAKLEVRDAGSDEDAAKQVIAKAREKFDAIDKELRSVDLIESYREILDDALEREGHSVEDEYLQIKRELRFATGPYADRAAELMERWATSNTRHIRFVAKVFAVRADRLTNRKVVRSGT